MKTRKSSFRASGLVFLLFLSFFVSSRMARAAGESFDFSALTSATNAAVESVLKTIAIGTDHRPSASATPLGSLIGLEIGADLTLISIPQDFKDALTLMGSAATFPSALPLPRLSIRKGLPRGFDVGLSGIFFRNYRITGGDLQWTFLKGGAPVMAAVRLGMNWASLDVIKAHSTSFDFVVSRKLPVIDPYLGFGWQWASGQLDVASGGVGGLPVGISPSRSFSNFRFFAGLPINLYILKLVPEYNWSAEKVSTYGLKLVFSF